MILPFLLNQRVTVSNGFLPSDDSDSWHYSYENPTNWIKRFFGSCDGIAVLVKQAHEETEEMWKEKLKYIQQTNH
jgi:hypothetical protein